MGRYDSSFILILIFLVSIPFVLSTTINGAWIGPLWVECNVSDGHCPSDYDPLGRPCAIEDTDCVYNFSLFIDGCALCADTMCGDLNPDNPDAEPGDFIDDYCPTENDPLGRFCYSLDDDCNQCMIFNTTIFAEDEPVNNGSQINLTSLVHGDACTKPDSLTLNFSDRHDNPYCYFAVEWKNLTEELFHEFINHTINATGYVTGKSIPLPDDLPANCSEKDVSVNNYHINNPFTFIDKNNNNLQLPSNSSGGFTMGEIKHNCSIIIQGNVTDTFYGSAVPDVSVKLRHHNGTVIYDNKTRSDGWYYINLNEKNLPNIKEYFGEDNFYELRFTKTDYSPYLYEHLSFHCNSTYEYNATMQEADNLCQWDCTQVGSNICDSQCDGWKGCDFGSIDNVRDVCDPNPDDPRGGSVVGHIRTDDDGNSIICCRGGTITGTIHGDVEVPEDARNVIKTTRVVFLKGQPVKLNVVVYD